MTKEEKDKIIAEFMKTEAFYPNQIVKYRGGEDASIFRVHYNLKDLKYSFSWDWLMPVVEKIEAFCLEQDDKTGGDLIIEFYQIRDCVPEIHRVYNSVVEFIKKYVNE